MLDVWILNVGHGDSIVLRWRTDTGYAFGVVDSNRIASERPACLTKLDELQAEHLSFVVLTHPHADHYRGLLSLLETYKGRIGVLYTFPLGEFIRSKKANLCEIFEAKIKGTDGSLQQWLLELYEILVIANEESRARRLKHEEVTGRWSQLFPPQGQPVLWEAMLPLPRSKGRFFELLGQSDPAALSSDVPNALSVVLRVTVAGTSILLGADSTRRNWQEHAHELRPHNKRPDARAIKVPHHGSHLDVTRDLLPHWFGDMTDKLQRFALISADGRRHPHSDVLTMFEDADIHPYCTNLASACGGRKIGQLIAGGSIAPEVAQVINSGDIELRPALVQVCQGEIHCHIDADGSLSVTPQFAHPCGFRGDFARLGVPVADP